MKTNWYENAIVYQIYPLSFMDSNNEGFGDIDGIISKLDYIKDLGVNAIWFSPLYKSPDYDYGYDISDYKAIDKKFGTMEDFDRLLKECHSRDIKVIMDMAINHSSIEHEWFKKALESPDSKYRDYYIIKEGIKKNGKLLPPTNWASTFTGSAWKQIDGTDEFYLHLFCEEQADLNWENEEVRKEVIDIFNFWLDKGVDGFRLDVFNMFSKTYPFKDDDSKKTFQKGAKYFIDGPRIHEFIKELNEKSFSKYDCYTVGESYRPSKEEAHEYVKKENKELDTIFNFAHLDSDNIDGKKFFLKPFNLKQFKEGLFEPQIEYYKDGWNTLVLENHDNVRSVSRFGIDTKHYRYEAATFLATITYLGFGTPYIYMGQEIGMTNTDFKNVNEMKDPVSHFVYDLMTSYKMPKRLAFGFINFGARDHARVPMSWDDSINGGFNEGQEPWQSLNTNYKQINVKKDLESDKSIYRYYQKLLQIKKNNKAAIYGETKEYYHDHNKIIAYSRKYEDTTLFVIGNFSKRKVTHKIPEWLKDSNIILNNYDNQIDDKLNITFEPYQAIVFEVKE